MAAKSRSPSLTNLEVQLLQSIQEKSNTFLDFVAFAIHRIVRDDIVIFSAPTAYFLAADPHFGLSLLVTMCLTELTNGMVKLYCVRPRPLWVSTKLRRKGTVWEKDSSFPSSHTQSVATLFSFLFLEGEGHLPHTIWVYATFLTGCLTLLTGFSRAYLAMHFISDVAGGCCLGFLVAVTVTGMDVVGTFAQVSVPWAVFLSLSSTACILGCLFLAAHFGQTATDQKSVDKWLQTALRNSKKAPDPNNGREGDQVGGKVVERITPHSVESYVVLAAAYLCSTLFPALLSLRHPHHPRSPIHSPLTFYRPYTTTATKPSLSFWAVGVLGLLVLNILKSLVANRKQRGSWPVWKQAAFYLVFYAISIAWVLAGSGFVHARQGWVGGYM